MDYEEWIKLAEEAETKAENEENEVKELEDEDEAKELEEKHD
nr:hypothetical protein [Tanacetum cinerariifolium]